MDSRLIRWRGDLRITSRSRWRWGAFLGSLLIAVALTSCGSEDLTQQRSTQFIVDASGSMLGPKFEAAKAALITHLQGLATGEETGLRVLGSLGCEATELAVPLGSGDQDKIITQLQALQADGPTPLALALREAGEDLAQVSEGDRTIVVFTDGAETCDGDPCAEARALRDRGITVHLVGFEPVDDLTRAQYDCITHTTGGVYFDLASPDFLSVLLGNLACETCAMRDVLILAVITVLLSLAGVVLVSRFL